MAYYESVSIFRGDLEEQKVAEMGDSIKGWIEQEGGALLNSENWGKKRLTYRIKKQRYGNYLLSHFEIDPSKIQPMEWNLKLKDEVLRHLTFRITKKELDDLMPKDAPVAGEETAKAGDKEEKEA